MADPAAEDAEQLRGLIRRHHPDYGARVLGVLDVSPGDGALARQLADERLAVTVGAPPEQDTGLPSLTIPPDPDDFLTPRFAAILALSVFPGLPDRIWPRWLRTLYYNLERNGLLIFAAPGRHAHEAAGGPRLDPVGFAQTPAATIVTPGYVIDRIDLCPNAELVAFETNAWRGALDLWVLRKTVTPFARNALQERAGFAAEIAALEAARAAMLSTTSWRLTAPLRAAGRLLRR